MIALIDLGLIVIDAELWGRDQAAARSRSDTIAVHVPSLRKYGQLRLLWSDDFYAGFPWNEPSCPPLLRDYCAVVNQFVEVLRGQGRLLSWDDLPDVPEAPHGPCALEPDLLAECGVESEELQSSWRRLLTAAAFGDPRPEGALCLPTWPRPKLAAFRDVMARHGASISLPLICSSADWEAFVGHYYRPELRGLRVTVLVGDLNRPAFERARTELAAYGLVDCRRLPSLFEQNRTKAQTIERLREVDLLVVCTNRIKHADTDQLKSDQITCAVALINQDSEAAIVGAVLSHFRKRELDRS